MTDRSEIAAGLSKSVKEISPKWFYDQRGSELFEAITQLPEYYPTRAERALLESFAPDFVARHRPASLVELGAGAADKTRILLDAMTRVRPDATYVPIDISAQFLERTAATLRADYPELTITPVAADITAALQIPPGLDHPAIIALLGGTIGNFEPPAAVSLLVRARSEMRENDRFLLGADLEKDPAILEAAYNDSEGVTAAFNLNVLRVLNQELGADFDPEDFRHRAFYDATERRIEMHLVAQRPVTVTVPETGRFEIADGETIRTEISYKYDRPRVAALMEEAGLTLEEWLVGEPGFALAVGSR